jgi:bacteriorhodopsin
VTISAPWTATLTQSEHSITLFFLGIGALALFAGFLRTLATRNEVGTRYQTAVTARLAVTGVASLVYLLLLVRFEQGYDLVGIEYVPNPVAMEAFSSRYIEWAITVPLLTVELLAVTTLVGATLRRTRMFSVVGTFAMIFTGFLGSIVIGGGTSLTALVVFGSVSTVFWIAVTLLLARGVRRSFANLTPASAIILRNATIVLLGGWFVYPVIYTIQIFGDGGGWATTMQIALCSADIVVKVVFGGLTHRLAKLRTAEDVRAGSDVHPEAIWISSEKQSDAGSAREVYIAADSVVHQRRVKPAENTAIASPVVDRVSDFE